MTIDHIKRISSGGTYDISNLTGLCDYCHQCKDNQGKLKRGKNGKKKRMPYIPPSKKKKNKRKNSPKQGEKKRGEGKKLVDPMIRFRLRHRGNKLRVGMLGKVEGVGIKGEDLFLPFSDV